ncbi:signal peptide peptidase-domain-containing protein [Xylariales sp. PMI_506]|nr:signal peptide peptidase-domain-containing protein [Xylariales sp. PMI_506]
MADSSTGEIPITGLDIQGNLTLFESVSQLPATLWKHRELFVLEARLVGSALALIYLGSQAALRRPPSAKPPKKKSTGNGADDDEDDQFVQGLQPSDAILFPILAGTVLVGLYYLIQWLKDPAILNKILGVYFSVMSLASLGKLLADTLHFATGFIFPDAWRDSKGVLWKFDGAKKCQYHDGDSGQRIYDESMKSPVPGNLFSRVIVSNSNRSSIWELRHLLKEHWTIRFAMHGIGKEIFQVKLNDVLGVVLAIGASITYQSIKSVFLSNVMGWAFSYVGIVTLSPTTFMIGSSLLVGLFFYDIYMVFYTPYMVTVATKLDIPIKLVFEGPKRSSMLGLGDIVVPGIFIALCLRFDHYMYYYRQRKLVPVELQTEAASREQLTTTTKETQHMVVKPTYINPQGQWGNRFWSFKLWGSGSNVASQQFAPAVKAASFPKPYFYAAMFGYLVAMMVTLAMLLLFKHAQPALLYLVPGVVSAVWITGAVRGELKNMWQYTEDGSLDKQDIIVEVDGEGKLIREIDDDKEKKDGTGEGENNSSNHLSVSKGKDEVNDGKKDSAVKEPSRRIFLLSIDAPPHLQADEDE